MLKKTFLAAVVLGCCGRGALAEETVGVSGSAVRFATALETKVGEKTVKLVLTGTALRKKYFFSVYAVASYLAEGDAARTPEELAASNSPKQLHLVLERDVDGKDMAAAFKEAIRQNYPGDAFADEVNALVEFMQGTSARKGDHVLLTHVPGEGFHCEHVEKRALLIKNAQFSKAVWDIYLGKNNLGVAIKQGLVSRR
jgi:hypothetical protein